MIRLAAPSPNHVYRSSAVYEAYRSDLGEQEAYSTGTGYADLSVGALEDSELSDGARSLHNLTPPIISGNIPDSYAIIQSALENLGYLGIDNLRSKAQDETITANERVILDAAEYVERKAKAWSVVGGVSDKKHRGNDVEPEVAARKDPRRGAIVLEQDESSVSPSSPDDGGISGRTAHRTQRSLLDAGSQSRPSGAPSSEVADDAETQVKSDVEFGQSPVLVSGTGEIAGIGGGVAPENGGERAGRMGSQDGAAHSTRRMGEIPQGAARSVEAHLPKRLSNGPKYYIGNGKSFFVDADQKYMDGATVLRRVPSARRNLPCRLSITAVYSFSCKKL